MAITFRGTVALYVVLFAMAIGAYWWRKREWRVWKTEDAQEREKERETRRRERKLDGDQIRQDILASERVRLEAYLSEQIACEGDRIAAAALRLADEGLAAVSMRRLAAELGAGTMSLYRHVSGRDDVVKLIVDAAYCSEPPPAPTGDWRADLRALTGRTRRIMLAHPWLAFEAPTRPRFGPNALRQNS